MARGRGMCALVAFTVAVFAAAAEQPQAHIKIDTDRIVGEVDPHLFGSFAGHLGRCIYGGIYDEGSPLDLDHNGASHIHFQSIRLPFCACNWTEHGCCALFMQQC
jgi:alpha-L-arabinofuranosidase